MEPHTMNRSLIICLIAVIVFAAVITSIITTTKDTPAAAAINTSPTASTAAATNTTPDNNPESTPPTQSTPDTATPDTQSTDTTPPASTENNPNPVPLNPPSPQPDPFWIERTPVNGQDLADLNNLTIWKYNFRIPRNQYTHYLWLERWERDGIEPVEIRELATLTGVWEDGNIILKLPSELDSRLYVKLGNTMLHENAENPVQPPDPWRLDLLDKQTLTEPTNAVYLMAYTYNAETLAEGGLAGAHENNDITVYIKMRFAPGEFVPFDAQREVLDLR